MMLLSASFVAIFSLVMLTSSPRILGSPQLDGSAFSTFASSKTVPTVFCDDYQILGFRATGEPQSGSSGYANLIKIVKATIPGGSSMEVDFSSIPEYVLTPIQGAHTAIKYLTSQSLKCPNQKYVLVGYSKGAMVVTELMSVHPINPDKLAAVVLFGNPAHAAGAPQNRCSGTGGYGLSYPYTAAVPSEYVPLIYDCCIEGDMVCQTMGSMLPHLWYGGSRDEKRAASFVISQLRSRLDRGPPGIDELLQLSSI